MKLNIKHKQSTQEQDLEKCLFIGFNMTIKINCIICKKEIEHPETDQLTCGSKECRRKYRNESCFVWKEINKERAENYNRNYQRERYHKENPNAKRVK